MSDSACRSEGNGVDLVFDILFSLISSLLDMCILISFSCFLPLFYLFPIYTLLILYFCFIYLSIFSDLEHMKNRGEKRETSRLRM